ncbi:2705_t:CDS:2 [Acaulospora colombiana]|uniref:2705_t:CDS:1 n=1 Tax=Acaulospora colombiana TaxID=27376 RepID=A0ACA9NLH0_9GLOM|nr:2705_t:CDS:2 [Acaulospora colombiana]
MFKSEVLGCKWNRDAAVHEYHKSEKGVPRVAGWDHVFNEPNSTEMAMQEASTGPKRGTKDVQLKTNKRQIEIEEPRMGLGAETRFLVCMAIIEEALSLNNSDDLTPTPTFEVYRDFSRTLSALGTNSSMMYKSTAVA